MFSERPFSKNKMAMTWEISQQFLLLHPHGGSQPPVTLVPGYLTSSPSFCGHCTHTWYTHMHVVTHTYVHKIKIIFNFLILKNKTKKNKWRYPASIYGISLYQQHSQVHTPARTLHTGKEERERKETNEQTYKIKDKNLMISELKTETE